MKRLIRSWQVLCCVGMLAGTGIAVFFAWIGFGREKARNTFDDMIDGRGIFGP